MDLRSIGPGLRKAEGLQDRVGSPKKLIDCDDQTAFVVVSDSTTAVTRILTYETNLLCIHKNTQAKV